MRCAPKDQETLSSVPNVLSSESVMSNMQSSGMSGDTAWSRLRREIRAVVRLAAPVVSVQVGLMLMGVVDSMMLGRLSGTALAASALGNSLLFGMIMFPMGILMALDPLIAQAFGAEDHHRVGVRFQQGVVVAVVLAIPLSLLMWDTEWLMRFFKQAPEIIDPAAAYTRWVVPGNLPFLLFVALRQTLQAMSLVRPAFIAIVAGNVMNVLANYCLIFGNWGFPALGVVGSAWATSVSRWMMLIVLVWSGRRFLKRYWLRLSKVWTWNGYRKIFGIGVPIGWQMSLELWLFVAVALLIGNLGSRELAAHQIALNLASLAFMVPLGISGAAATRVGNAIGRGEVAAARRSAFVCLAFGATVMSFSGLVFFFAPELLSRLYTNEVDIIALAVQLIPIAALFQVFDGLQVVGAGVLRGTADTRFAAIIALIGYWFLGLPLGVFLAFRQGLGPQGLWLGLSAGLASVAVLFIWRIRHRFKGEILAVEDREVSQ